MKAIFLTNKSTGAVTAFFSGLSGLVVEATNLKDAEKQLFQLVSTFSNSERSHVGGYLIEIKDYGVIKTKQK